MHLSSEICDDDVEKLLHVLETLVKIPVSQISGNAQIPDPGVSKAPSAEELKAGIQEPAAPLSHPFVRYDTPVGPTRLCGVVSRSSVRWHIPTIPTQGYWSECTASSNTDRLIVSVLDLDRAARPVSGRPPTMVGPEPPLSAAGSRESPSEDDQHCELVLVGRHGT